MKYHQNTSNSCCFSSLASEFTAPWEHAAARTIELQIEEPFNCQYIGYQDRINFAISKMIYRVINGGEHSLYCKITQWKKKGSFDIHHDTSKNANLVQLMDTVGNINHAVSIFGHWIFESNYKNATLLKTKLLNIICSPSDWEGTFANFETLFYAIIYIDNTGKLKIGD